LETKNLFNWSALMLATENQIEVICPIGRIGILCDEDAVKELRFLGGPMHDDDVFIADREKGVAGEALKQLKAYFAGKLRDFDLPLAPEGTPFQKKVWKQLEKIRYGEVKSYLDIARAIGKPSGPRAVGAANGRNPIAIIVPCHRVIGASGKLVGFGGGLPTKKWLLLHENPHFNLIG
jgi:methylated-DNA-[protein]-cysteine S-methyltransferase